MVQNGSTIKRYGCVVVLVLCDYHFFFVLSELSDHEAAAIEEARKLDTRDMQSAVIEGQMNHDSTVKNDGKTTGKRTLVSKT